MRSAIVSLVVVVLVAAFASVVLAQTMSISTVDDSTGTLALYKEDGDDLNQFALAEIKGRVEFDSSGIVDGEESFLRLKILEQGKWLKVEKANLVNGKLVITTEDGNLYTIYELQGDYVGKIASGGSGGAGGGYPTIGWVVVILAVASGSVLLFRYYRKRGRQ